MDWEVDNNESAPIPKKKRLGDFPLESSTAVEQHYNEIVIQNPKYRVVSEFKHLRKFNNWVKSFLLRRYSRFVQLARPSSDVTALDLCGGKFGDLLKWYQMYKTSGLKRLALADIARSRIEEAIDRYNALLLKNENIFLLDVAVGDCFSGDLSGSFVESIPFNIVSCQFALHYAFESEEKATTAIENISRVLCKGGYFIGTIPDSDAIINKLKAKGKAIGGDLILDEGGSDFRIVFKKKTFRDLIDSLSEEFGVNYQFYLRGSVNDCEEFLVKKKTLIRLCKDFGLKCVQIVNFHQFYMEALELDLEEHIDMRRALENILYSEKGRELFSAKEWEICGLYTTFAFVKTRGEDVPPSRNFTKETKVVEKKEIKNLK